MFQDFVFINLLFTLLLDLLEYAMAVKVFVITFYIYIYIYIYIYQPSNFTLAASNCRGFCQDKQCFYSNQLGKNIAEMIMS